MADSPSTIPSARRTAILGQGYVGLPLAVQAVRAGHHVIGFDPDAQRVKRLRAAESPTPDVPDDQLASALTSGAYTPTTRPDALAGCGIAVIAVPTPLRGGAPDVSAIRCAARTLAPHLRPGALVVLESTTYPGTTEEVTRPARTSAMAHARNSGG
ncbi:NAD(P)-binding domain-containing protein [Streptomyces sp. NPDC050738]|uniref:NAD(P)-binding domain-containing protein n=1 Tax=Streptomyces sp. NPDC050738 TaxID=3154744 RepID=UPI003417F165